VTAKPAVPGSMPCTVLPMLLSTPESMFSPSVAIFMLGSTSAPSRSNACSMPSLASP
jgi:hypothetical protein